jgi:hypothetical protein
MSELCLVEQFFRLPIERLDHCPSPRRPNVVEGPERCARQLAHLRVDIGQRLLDCRLELLCEPGCIDPALGSRRVDIDKRLDVRG